MSVLNEIKPSTTAEMSVIGCVMIDDSTIHVVREILKPEDFYDKLNQRVYEEMLYLADSGQSINISTLMNRLIYDETFNKFNGINLLTESSGMIPSASFIEEYAYKVKKESTRRKLSLFADAVKDIISKPIEDIGSVISSLNDRLYELNECTLKVPWRDFNDVLSETCEKMIDKTTEDCVKSGYVDLDLMTNGFRPGTLTIIAARPAMGKTALGLNIMTNAAIKNQISTAFFSLEMTCEELMNRILSNLASVNGNSIKNKMLRDDEWGRILEVAEKYTGSPIHIDETPGIDISVLRDRVVRMHKQFGIKLLIVDYLQLMRSDKKRIQNREQEVADISRSLKGIAKELHIPVIALSQLNRAVNARAEKRPVLSDLRESGSIEQDADNIMFIHREDYYHPNDTPTNEAEIIIAKQRSGPTGTVKLRWTGEFTRFDTLENRF